MEKQIGNRNSKHMTATNLNLDAHIKKAIEKAIRTSISNVEAAAKLGISERTFYNLLKQYKIQIPKRIYIKLENVDGYLLLNTKPTANTIKRITEIVQMQ
jgi:predicted DNA-binding transcriptional regulator AlpA